MKPYQHKVVAIDGPSGAGKSTVSRLLAKRLGFQFLDTGSLYRAIGLYLLEKGLYEESRDDEIRDVLKDLKLSYREDKVYISRVDYSELIRTPKAGHYASVFSAKKSVRNYLLDLQREFATKMDLVAEGRDMTTVVFPDAWKKFYLDASQQKRAERRYDQMKEFGKPISYEDAIKDIVERDKRDMNRLIAPLKIADDAIYIDSTYLSIQEVVETMLSYCNSR
ncbi:MAG: (d)CMP kinase [Thermodesulfovibrionales bacterium]|nr:(d)CMP kinase [Thermodesulfovibrionales bacterium]